MTDREMAVQVATGCDRSDVQEAKRVCTVAKHPVCIVFPEEMPRERVAAKTKALAERLQERSCAPLVVAEGEARMQIIEKWISKVRSPVVVVM